MVNKAEFAEAFEKRYLRLSLVLRFAQQGRALNAYSS